LPTAYSICETGFAALSSLDDGWYGKGIYFTSYAVYTVPYISRQKAPVIIVSWVLPGNVYPVIENSEPSDTTQEPKGLAQKHQEASLKGAPIQNGYNSHYVVVDEDGKIGHPQSKELFNEFVIAQESQIVPAFIFEIVPAVVRKKNSVASWLNASKSISIDISESSKRTPRVPSSKKGPKSIWPRRKTSMAESLVVEGAPSAGVEEITEPKGQSFLGKRRNSGGWFQQLQTKNAVEIV